MYLTLTKVNLHIMLKSLLLFLFCLVAFTVPGKSAPPGLKKEAISNVVLVPETITTMPSELQDYDVGIGIEYSQIIYNIQKENAVASRAIPLNNNNNTFNYNYLKTHIGYTITLVINRC